TNSSAPSAVYTRQGSAAQASICRTFHRHFGMSPTRYRRDTTGKERYIHYPLRMEMEIEQARRSAAAAEDRDQPVSYTH
ncbi:hypothetical protein Q8F93_27055, partial [Klebsiella pneumoniae]|nr:hypothetical protein [Klebsiella pneumoniae]